MHDKGTQRHTHGVSAGQQGEHGGVLGWHDLARRNRGSPVAERRAAQLVAPVGRGPVVERRAEGDDTRRVHVGVHDVVVPLDVGEVDRVAEAGRLEEVTRVAPQRRHLDELAPVALEVAVVDGVEAHERREEAHVGLGDVVADEVAPSRQALLEQVEVVPQPAVGLVVGVLGAGEAAPVDTVVDVAVDRLAHRLDLVGEGVRVEVRRTLPVELPPLGLEVDGDLLEVVRHDGTCRHVDDRGHRDATGVFGVAREVGVLDARALQHRVEAAGVEVEGPAAPVVRRPADPHRQRVLEPEQPAHDDRAVGPGARPRDDETVAARLDGEAVAPVGGDAGRDVARVALEALLDIGARLAHAPTLIRYAGWPGGAPAAPEVPSPADRRDLAPTRRFPHSWCSRADGGPEWGA